MKRNFIKFKIPTLLGLSIIVLGIVVGVFLTLQQQIIVSKASPDVTAQNITLSNLTDNEVTLSWTTPTPASSFISLGQTTLNEQTFLDDKDSKTPKPHLMHYVTVKNLLPKTTYQYKIVTGKISSQGQLTTATPTNLQTGARPVIGSVLDEDKVVEEGIAYLSIDGATTQSAQVKMGNFLIPTSQIRKADLSGSLPLTEDTIAKLTIISSEGSASAVFKFATADKLLSPLKLGQNIDLTSEILAEPSPPSYEDLTIYDLNHDGKINAADYASVLLNFGKNPKDKKTDLNKDRVVNQTDLDLMAKQINQ